MEEIRRSAPSVEEALAAALAELGVTEQEADVEVEQEPRQGLFGVGAQEAVVVVRVRAPREEISAEDIEDQAEVGADFVDALLAKMGIEATVEPNLEDGTMYVDVIGPEPDDEDMGLLIGRHGQTLEALQELTRAAVAQRTGMRSRVVVDVEDYKKRQRDRLEARALEVARRVAATGSEEEFEPMNPYQRKIVHDVVGGVEGVESSSHGEDPDRRLVVRPTR